MNNGIIFREELGFVTVISSELNHFTCASFEANPAVDNVWFLNDIPTEDWNAEYIIGDPVIVHYLYPPDDSHYTYNTNNTLSLVPTVSEHQDAILTCEGSNIVPPAVRSNEIHLNVIGKCHQT